MKVTSNKTKKHFTITVNGRVYRTTQMSKEQFEECDYNTAADWINYIKTNEVIIIK